MTTLEPIAHLTFEPQKVMNKLPSPNKHYANAKGDIINIRIAAAIMGQTKEELIEAWGKDADLVFDMLEKIGKTIKKYEAALELLQTAEARIIVAGEAAQAAAA